MRCMMVICGQWQPPTPWSWVWMSAAWTSPCTSAFQVHLPAPPSRTPPPSPHKVFTQSVQHVNFQPQTPLAPSFATAVEVSLHGLFVCFKCCGSPLSISDCLLGGVACLTSYLSCYTLSEQVVFASPRYHTARCGVCMPSALGMDR